MIASNPNDFLWVEKYRPKRVEDCILPDRIKEYATSMLKKGEPQNLMLTGSAGTGKTTLAKALCEEMGLDYILINCSEDGNIDTLRTTIRGFASSVSLMGNVKCVILDEADGCSNATQQGLRSFIEEFSNNCRFIFTANFGNKIIEPLKSRTIQIDMSLTKSEKMSIIKGIDTRVKDILAQEQIEFDTKVLATIVMKYFPDFRKVINELQRLCIDGVLDSNSMAIASIDVVKDVYKMLKAKSFSDMRKWVSENPENDFVTMFKMLWTKVDEYVEPDSIPQMLLHINQYQLNHAVVVDKEINLMAFLTELMVDLKFK